MSKKQNRRQVIRARNRRRQLKSRLIWGSISLGVVGLIGFLIWTAVRPAAGEAFPLQFAEHIPDGEPLPAYNSNPPTSGAHYSRGLDPGFYDETALNELPPNPEGHLMHNLEHGYIIFWYNCNLLDETGCSELKAQIFDYMENSPVPKLIAFPWETTDTPLALTSWGYMLEFDEFNERQATNFINSNRTRAPEPNAP